MTDRNRVPSAVQELLVLLLPAAMLVAVAVARRGGVTRAAVTAYRDSHAAGAGIDDEAVTPAARTRILAITCTRSSRQP